MRPTAIINLYPEVKVVRGNVPHDKDNNIVSIDETKVTTEIIRLQAEYDAQEYARNRVSAFPSIGDQLDMQFHDLVDGTTTWKDAIAKVKEDNPKPDGWKE